jgi:putative glutamine amidotransferase
MRRVGLTYRYDEKLPPYREALRAVGIEPVLITPSTSPIEPLDALVVSGGTDIDPSWYGQEPHSQCEPPDIERDRLECSLVEDALARDIPLLCICRGMQVLNVALGGTLVQHMDGHVQRGVADAHEIDVIEGTKLASILGAGRHPVNSRHHQAIGAPGKGLIVSARSTDGWIEGLELPGKPFAIAVQWHPEDLIATHAESKALFHAFAAAT